MKLSPNSSDSIYGTEWASGIDSRAEMGGNQGEGTWGWRSDTWSGREEKGEVKNC